MSEKCEACEKREARIRERTALIRYWLGEIEADCDILEGKAMKTFDTVGELIEELEGDPAKTDGGGGETVKCKMCDEENEEVEVDSDLCWECADYVAELERIRFNNPKCLAAWLRSIGGVPPEDVERREVGVRGLQVLGPGGFLRILSSGKHHLGLRTVIILKRQEEEPSEH